MTEINVNEIDEAADQTAAAAIVGEVIGADHDVVVTSSRCLAEEFRTPIAGEDTKLSRQKVAYEYDDDNGAPSRVRFIEDMSVMSVIPGNTYSRAELVAYIQTLNSIVSRIN